MLLLYCLNSLVVSIHDDQQPYVDPAYYGSGTRVIPVQSMAGLTVVPPPDPAPIPPPPPVYQQPTETPAILRAYASQVRYNYAVAGITFSAASGSVPVATDRISQMLINNLAAHAATLAPTATIDFTQNSIHYPLTAAECATLNTDVNNFVQQCRTIEASCLTDLNSPTPTILTYADVDAKFSGLRRMTVRLRDE
jgi:hypothetical protein